MTNVAQVQRSIRTFSPDSIRQRYPKISPFDIHYLGLQSHGVYEDQAKESPPKLQARGEGKTGVFLFRSFTADSPYVFDGEKVTFLGAALPFAMRHIGRYDPRRAYFRVRTEDAGILTLDNARILSVDFHPTCSGKCTFCFFDKGETHRSLNEEAGADMLRTQLGDLKDFDKIILITGLFPDERAMVNHIKKMAWHAHELGFRAKISYLGSQLKTAEALREVLEYLGELGLTFSYNYAIEVFANREGRVDLAKGLDRLEDIRMRFEMFRANGLNSVKYAYVAGLDDLDSFAAGAKLLADVARPGIGIFKAENIEHRNRVANDHFIVDPVGYLCEMRQCYEELYGRPVYGNQWGNLWPFPESRVSPKFIF